MPIAHSDSLAAPGLRGSEPGPAELTSWRGAPAGSDPGPHPLLATADPELLDDLLRLVASAGAQAQVAAHPQAARPGWADAPLVIVGADLAGPLAGLRLPRRPGVVVAGRDGSEADTALWGAAVGLGAQSVTFLPSGQQQLLDRLAWVDRVDLQGSVLAVVGGRGGAGASLFAVALCLAAVRAGCRPLLVDADPWGGGADLLLGAEAVAGLRWPDLAGLSGQVGGEALAESLPGRLGVSVVSWDRGAPVDLPDAALRAVLEAASRAYPLVVVDLPRRADPVSSAVLSRAATTYVVVPAEVRAAAAAARTLTWLIPGAGARLVVRTGRRRTLEPEDIAATLGLPLAAVICDDVRLAAAVDAGDNPGLRARSSLGRAATALVAGHLGSARARVNS
jgi:secretion/DNA translocation related CpaE-like protein